MTPKADPPQTIEIILFAMKGVSYAADATQVVRIDRMGNEGRALMVRSADGACHPVRVDAVNGLRTVPVTSLRQLPLALEPKEVAVGVWLNGETPVILLDLLQLLTVPGGR
jgi:chemotaxis signal transduction protein